MSTKLRPGLLVLALVLALAAPAPAATIIRETIRLSLHANQPQTKCGQRLPRFGSMVVAAWVDGKWVKGYVRKGPMVLFPAPGVLVEASWLKHPGPLCAEAITWRPGTTSIKVTYSFKGN